MKLRSTYAQDLSAKVAAGDRVCLRLRLQDLVDDAWTSSSLDGRTFVQRLLDRSGAEILRIPAALGSDDGGDFADFAISGDETWALLASGKAAIDIEHAVQEVLSDTENDTIVWPTPFAVRRIFAAQPGPEGAGGSGAPVVDLTVQRGPEGDQFIIRYAGQGGLNGAPGSSYLQALIDEGVLSEGATDADFVAWLLLQTETASMATKFFTEETNALGAGQTFHGVWRDSGASPGELTVIGSFVALMASDQPVDGWIEYSADGVTPLGQGQAATIAGDGRTVPIVLPLAARYSRPAIQNTSGVTANVSVTAGFGR